MQDSLDFSWFDARGYETLDVRDGYRLWSATYDQPFLDEMDVRLLERIETIAWPASGPAADLACGTGRIGAWLRSRGVESVDGVDLTPEMLRQAADKRVYRALHEADLRKTPLPDAAYGLVTNVLAVEHLPELDPLYTEAARIARPGGRLVVVGYHWHFLLSGIPTHFDVAPGRSLAIVNQVHLMSAHVRAAHRVGWRLAELHERVVDEAWATRQPAWKKYVHRPVSFAVVWELTAKRT
jgi:SAM-dependent methyltransferase